MTGEEGKITIRPTAAFVISLIAGILIIINGLILGVVSSFMPMIPNIVSQYAPLNTIPTGALQIVQSVLTILTAVGVILGAIIIIGAVMIYQTPSSKTGWGVVILVLSIVSIIIGGGFIIGLVLGIVGGALALSFKPSR
jgi:hypothetical protein